VGAVKRVGGVDREVRVELDDARMAALRVSALDVSRQLRNVQREARAGAATSAAPSSRCAPWPPSQRAGTGAHGHPAAGRAPRAPGRGRESDRHRVRAARAGRAGWRKVVGFEVFRTRGASETEVAEGARAAVAELQKAHPNVVLREVIDNAEPVQENFDASMEMLYEGAILAVLVVWWFLRDWRATFVAAAALPLSVIPAFLGQYLFGYTLNMVTLLSLALVVGVLVDDAIVEIENIARHLHMGKSRCRRRWKRPTKSAWR
jgi:multidrug efflux pump subunit AcrB